MRLSDIGLQVHAVDIRISQDFRRKGRRPGSAVLPDKLLRGTSFVRGAGSGAAPRAKRGRWNAPAMSP